MMFNELGTGHKEKKGNIINDFYKTTAKAVDGREEQIAVAEIHAWWGRK